MCVHVCVLRCRKMRTDCLLKVRWQQRMLRPDVKENMSPQEQQVGRQGFWFVDAARSTQIGAAVCICACWRQRQSVRGLAAGATDSRIVSRIVGVRESAARNQRACALAPPQGAHPEVEPHAYTAVEDSCQRHKHTVVYMSCSRPSALDANTSFTASVCSSCIRFSSCLAVPVLLPVCLQFYRDYDRALNTYMGSEGIGMDLTLVRVSLLHCGKELQSAEHHQLLDVRTQKQPSWHIVTAPSSAPTPPCAVLLGAATAVQLVRPAPGRVCSCSCRPQSCAIRCIRVVASSCTFSYSDL